MKQEYEGFINYIGKRPTVNSFDESIIHYKDGKFVNALKCINCHIKNNKHDVQAHYMKVHLLECMERWHEAIICIEQIVDKKDVNPDIILLRSLQYMHVGNTNRSLELINIAQKAGAFAGDVYRYRAKVMYGLTIKKHAKLFDDAIKWIQESCNIDPQNIQNLNEAANILYTKFEENGRVDTDILAKSIKYGRKALELGDKQLRTYYNLGRAWFHMDKMDTAIECFEQAVKIDRDFANTHAMIGISIMMRHKKNKGKDDSGRAKKYLDKALKKNPKLAFALQAKAKLQLDEWNFKGAQEILKVLTKVEPDNTQAWICLAVTYAEQWGRDPVVAWPKMERAAQCLEKAHDSAKHDKIPAGVNLERAAGNSDPHKRRNNYRKFTILDFRYDTVPM